MTTSTEDRIAELEDRLAEVEGDRANAWAWANEYESLLVDACKAIEIWFRPDGIYENPVEGLSDDLAEWWQEQRERVTKKVMDQRAKDAAKLQVRAKAEQHALKATERADG